MVGFGSCLKSEVSLQHVYYSVTLIGTFLANVNSCPRDIYVVVRLFVVCLSVTFVHPTQTIEIFRNIFTPFGT